MGVGEPQGDQPSIAAVLVSPYVEGVRFKNPAVPAVGAHARGERAPGLLKHSEDISRHQV